VKPLAYYTRMLGKSGAKDSSPQMWIVVTLLSSPSTKHLDSATIAFPFTDRRPH